MRGQLKTVTFNGDISKFSQKRLAQWAIDRKNNVYGMDIDVIVKGADGSQFNFDTINCVDVNQVLEKNQSLFDKVGLPKFEVIITKNDNGEFRNIILDNGMVLTTENCSNISDFKVVNQNVINHAPADIIYSVKDYLDNNPQIFNSASIENDLTKSYEEIASLNNIVDESNMATVAPVSPISESVSANIKEYSEKIEELEKRKNRLNADSKYWELYALGKFNSKKEKTVSFEERREQTKEKMSKLESDIAKYQSMDLATDLTTANQKLKEVVYRPGRFLTDETSNAVKFYSTVTSHPNKDNIIEALKLAQTISVADDDIKKALTTSIVNLYQQQLPYRKDEYGNDINNYLESNNLKTDKQILDDSKVELEKLKNDIIRIDLDERVAKHQASIPLNGYKEELRKIEEEINEIRMNGIEQQETGLVATEKEIVNNSVNKNEEINLNEKLLLLENRKNSLVDTITYLEKVCLGEIDMNGVRTPSFESRKQELKEQITKLESEVAKYQSMNIATDLTTANELLNKVAHKPGRFLSGNTSTAMKLHSDAVALPSRDNIMKLLESAKEISVADEDIKNALLTVCVYLNERYINETDEKNEINNYIAGLNFKTDKQKMDSCVNEMNKLNEQFNEIEKNEKEVINRVAGKLNAQKQELIGVENEINSIKEKMKSNVEQFMPDTKLIEDQQNKVSNNENGVTKETGRIFTDEERVTEKDRMLSMPNEKYEGKLGNDKKMVLDGVDITPKDDKFRVPHPIKAIKKAGKSLIEKISSINFKQKIKDALNWFSKHKVATFIMGAVALGVVAASSFGKSNDAPVVNGTNIENSYEQDDKDDSYNVAPPSLINQDALDDAIKDLNIGSNRPGFDNINFNNNDNNNNVDSQTNSFNDVVGDLSNNIIDGSAQVYTQENHAFDEINAVPTSDLYTPAWENAEANAFFTNENGNISQISQEQAEQNYNNGEEVVVRMENDGVNIGFVNIENGNQNNTGMSR